MNGYRQERDTMGALRVPEDALYGAETQRAVENFTISKMRLQRSFLRALGLLKSAAASANVRAGVLPVEIGTAISTPRNKWRTGIMTRSSWWMFFRQAAERPPI